MFMFPEKFAPVCVRVISIWPPPRLGLVYAHVPAHEPVTSTVGDVDGVVAHAARLRATRPINRNRFMDFSFVYWPSSRQAIGHARPKVNGASNSASGGILPCPAWECQR